MTIFNRSNAKSRKGRKPTRSIKNTRRNNRRKGSSMGKAIKLAALPVIALGAGGYAVNHYTNIEKPNAYGCYNREDQHQAVVFVDNSLTGQSGAHLRDYRTGLLRVYQTVPANSLIRITTTSRKDGGSFAQPTFILCKPAATPAEQAAIGAPEKSAPHLKRLERKAYAQYQSMVEQVIADAQDPDKAAKDSPILEQLQAISRYDGFDGPNRSLTIITDGISNSETARFCVVKGDMPPFEKFRTTHNYKYVAPRSFQGMDITFLLVEFGKLPAGSLKYCSNKELYDFWEDYARGNGAKSIDMRRLRYWQDS